MLQNDYEKYRGRKDHQYHVEAFLRQTITYSTRNLEWFVSLGTWLKLLTLNLDQKALVVHQDVETCEGVTLVGLGATLGSRAWGLGCDSKRGWRI